MERAAVPSMIREQRLNQWIEDYSDSFLRTCFLYLSDQNQAEGATQDAWIKVWKHMDDYERKSIANDKAWLLRIAINICKDYRRSAWFRHIDRNKALDELPPQVIAVEPEDRTLTLMVMDLPDRYKQVILLHFFQGLTMQETADVLNTSQPTVHRRLKKAVELLKGSLTGGVTYEGKRVLLNQAAMLSPFAAAVPHDPSMEDEMEYPDYIEMLLTRDAFVIEEKATFSFVADPLPVKYAKQPVSFEMPDGLLVHVENISVSADQIGMKLRITKPGSDQPLQLEDWQNWAIAVFAQGAETKYPEVNYSPDDDGSLNYNAHWTITGETNQLILIPVEAESYSEVINHQGPMTEEQQARMIHIDLKIMQNLQQGYNLVSDGCTALCSHFHKNEI